MTRTLLYAGVCRPTSSDRCDRLVIGYSALLIQQIDNRLKFTTLTATLGLYLVASIIDVRINRNLMGLGQK